MSTLVCETKKIKTSFCVLNDEDCICFMQSVHEVVVAEREVVGTQKLAFHPCSLELHEGVAYPIRDMSFTNANTSTFSSAIWLYNPNHFVIHCISAAANRCVLNE